MNAGTKKRLWIILLLLGGGLSLFLSLKCREDGFLDYRPNIGCINGSPYGKVLVLIMQDPIETYVHKGARHGEGKYLNDGEHDEHADHHHDHDGCAECEKEAAEIEAAKHRTPQDLPFHREAKQYLERLVAYTHRKNSGYKVTPAHEQYLQGVIEDKMRFSYELDPANNSNYQGLYLYLTIDNLGKSRANPKAAYELAKRTLEYCKRDQADPASMLTGANAAGDVGYYMGQNPDQFTWVDVEKNFKDFQFCLDRYGELLPKMLENGFRVSEARVTTMNEQALQLVTRLKAQRVYLRRIFDDKK